MSHVCVTETEKPVVLLRDSSSVQTVLLNSVLPLSDDIDLHKSVLVDVLKIYFVNHCHCIECV